VPAYPRRPSSSLSHPLPAAQSLRYFLLLPLPIFALFFLFPSRLAETVINRNAGEDFTTMDITGKVWARRSALWSRSPPSTRMAPQRRASFIIGRLCLPTVFLLSSSSSSVSIGATAPRLNHRFVLYFIRRSLAHTVNPAHL
jgi:hypothetical protein